ncbi:MAG TPA: hypothetical protein VH969_10340 [Actinophytocola sp.]|jgi:hypothetical protein|uniref:SCO4225 family membrane protein n=1 Tax=Actinophytocola sp. TaxID=1872138 RepID=UPI002F95A01C
MKRAWRAVPWRFRWVGTAYLLLIVGVAVFVWLATWGPLSRPGDASFAGIWLYLVAMPASLVVFVLAPAETGLPAFAELVAAGLAQGALFFMFTWWLDKRVAGHRDRAAS